MKHRFRKRLTILIAVGTVFGTVIAGAATHAAVPQRPIVLTRPGLPLPVSDDLLRMAAGSSASVPLTLITGDKVHIGLGSAGRPVLREIEAATRPGGEPVTFHTFTRHGNFHVVPNDALALLGDGILDWGLFDVVKLATLVAAGQAGQVPVLVTYQNKEAASRHRVAGTALPSINGRSVVIEGNGDWWRGIQAQPSAARSAGSLAGVRKVWLNELVPVSLDQSVAQIGAPVAWARGHDGTGVTVAVLDTGIDPNHPDVAGKIVGRVDFTGTSAEARDGHGHGTHVAATIAGTGAASNGQRKGVAPGAKLLVGKVCNDGGSCSFESIIAGMEWAANSEAKVINMSLGGGATDGTDPLSESLNNLSRTTGRLFVVAAGNSGPSSRTVGAPGAADEALTVAAVDKADQMADFSSRGPRFGDGAPKPDIAGPGVNIVAARAAGTAMGTPVDQHYTTASGTSMATPHVAGAAAIIAAKHPNLNGAQLKGFLMSSSNDLGHDLYAQGAGRVDLGRAIDPTLTTSGSLNFGRYPHPHSPVTRTLTYTNHTDQPIVLRLSTSVSSGGQPAPNGLFSLGASEVTVPANGTAEVTLAVNGAVLGDAGPYGGYNGLLNAHDAAGQLRVVSRVSAFLEPVRHELTVNVILPDGATAVSYGNAVIVPVDDKVNLHDNPITRPGGATFAQRLFGGTFAAAVAVSWQDALGRRHQAVPLAPEVNLTKATTVTLDLRKAKPVTVQGPEATENYHSMARFERVSATGAWSVTSEMETKYGTHDVTRWALPTPAVTMGKLTYDTYHVLVTPMVTLRAFGGGAPIDLAARYATPDVSVYGGGQQWSGGSRDVYLAIPRLPVDGKLGVVHAGAGTAAELSKVDARGKLVLIKPADICSGGGCPFTLLGERVAAAAAAGARGVLVAGPAGMTQLGTPNTQTVDCPNGPDSCPPVPPYAALPIVTVPAAEADRLIARLDKPSSDVEIKLDGKAKPTVYNVAFHASGQVPSNLPYRVGRMDLDRVEHRFHADKPGEITYFQWAQSVKSKPDPVWLRMPTTTTQGTLTAYVGRQPDSISRYEIDWSDYVAPNVIGAGRQEQQDLTVLNRWWNTVRWNTGPTVPGAARIARTPSGYTVAPGQLCAGCRQGDAFYPTFYLTSSSGARQAMAGIINDNGITSFLFGIDNCEASVCDFRLRNASGAEFERRLQHIEFRIGYRGIGGQR
ncbi:S8 family peptidase [Allorhizocola rhizosphaerae]|uniref:S8 family peptidase n=1 Tax=Allorhizocola rhizosphaerae TaxID=1872709 RepID=UPI000E3C5E15|nr:S8 family serine peptidase [Allorhizocola rhizosphaerae]